MEVQLQRMERRISRAAINSSDWNMGSVNGVLEQMDSYRLGTINCKYSGIFVSQFYIFGRLKMIMVGVLKP